MKQNTVPHKNYPYYNPSFAAAADGAEWRARNRRVGLFAKATNLTAISPRTKRIRKEFDQIPCGVRMDHVSAWQSEWGTLFMLNEPYEFHDGDVLALEDAGYEVRIVPTNLAPYGGCFDNTPGALPRTTSLLITKATNGRELDLIYEALQIAANTAPAWST